MDVCGCVILGVVDHILLPHTRYVSFAYESTDLGRVLGVGVCGRIVSAKVFEYKCAIKHANKTNVFVHISPTHLFNIERCVEVSSVASAMHGLREINYPLLELHTTTSICSAC